MRLIIHIGTEKTGTSTIQAFLAENRESLMATGTLIPNSLGSPNHRILAGIAMHDARTDEFFEAQKLLTAADRAAAKQVWLEAFERELSIFTPDTVIISSEHLQSRLIENEDIYKLKKTLSHYFDRIEILLYIREPVATAVSALSTACKYGSAARDIPPPNTRYFKNLIQHAKTAERWGTIFGPENLQIRLFETDAFLEGDLLADFCAAINISHLDLRKPQRINISLDGLGVAYLARINKWLEEKTGKPASACDRTQLLAFFERHFCNGPVHVPDRKLIEAYEMECADSNEIIRSRFFPNRKRLFTPFQADQDLLIPRDDNNLNRTACGLAELIFPDLTAST